MSYITERDLSGSAEEKGNACCRFQ